MRDDQNVLDSLSPVREVTEFLGRVQGGIGYLVISIAYQVI